MSGFERAGKKVKWLGSTVFSVCGWARVMWGVWDDGGVGVERGDVGGKSDCGEIYSSEVLKMGGGLMQLVAYGAQDVYLTSNPSVTFFKVVYRRHTNFAMESIEQTFNGAANFGRKVTCTIARNGDLITRCYLQATIPSVSLETADGSGAEFRWLNWLGHALIKEVELEIGGQKIDKHYGDWLHIWNELTQDAGKQLGYSEMVGNVPELVNTLTQSGVDCDDECAPGEPSDTNWRRKCAPEYTLYIPLQFWFCRNPGLALPLIALQYHEVRINLTFEELKNLCWDSTSSQTVYNRVAADGLVAASLYVDYIYLDTDERRRFAQQSHEYLIEQLQFTGDESITSSAVKIKLNFNHPVKELIWVCQRDSFVSCSRSVIDTWKGQQRFNYTDWWDRSVRESGYSATLQHGAAGKNPVITAKIQLNGHDRFSEREGFYFDHVQPFQHHTNVPSKGINVYSFGLKPEEHQPSGSCNMSRIDNATLFLTVSSNSVGCCATSKVRVYAVSYNVLRVMSGMAGMRVILMLAIVLLKGSASSVIDVIVNDIEQHCQIAGKSC